MAMFMLFPCIIPAFQIHHGKFFIWGRLRDGAPHTSQVRVSGEGGAAAPQFNAGECAAPPVRIKCCGVLSSLKRFADTR